MASLVEAIHNKYEQLENYKFPGLIILGSPGKTESGNPRVPNQLIMDSRDICHIGCMDSLIDMAGHLKELDLSSNKISSWIEVRDLLKSLPLLNHLNLAHNPLGRDVSPSSSSLITNSDASSLNCPEDFFISIDFINHHFALQTLVLNNTKIHWPFLLSFLRRFPRLTHLYISSNNYASPSLLLSPPPAAPTGQQDNDNNNLCESRVRTTYEELLNNNNLSSFSLSSIQHLYFNDNGLRHWWDFCLLGNVFPSLEQIVMLENALLDFPPASETDNDNETVSQLREELTRSFNELTHLSLSENPITNWRTVDALNHLPALFDLKIASVPLLQEFDEDTNRHHLIARLPRVTRLNGSLVDWDERERAERMFIRYFMDKNQSEQPPRYVELSEIHGPLEPLANISLRPNNVCVVVHCHDAQGLPLCPSKSFTFSLDLQVGQLKEELCSLFTSTLQKTPSRLLRLFYWDKEMGSVYGREEMKFPTRAVHSYMVRDGDEFFLELKPKVRLTSSSSQGTDNPNSP